MLILDHLRLDPSLFFQSPTNMGLRSPTFGKMVVGSFVPVFDFASLESMSPVRSSAHSDPLLLTIGLSRHELLTSLLDLLNLGLSPVLEVFRMSWPKHAAFWSVTL